MNDNFIKNYGNFIKIIEDTRKGLLKDIYSKKGNTELKKEYLKKYDLLLEGHYDNLLESMNEK